MLAPLDTVLRRNEDRFGRDGDALARLPGLIRLARKQADRQAIVLVDEYDAPLLNVAHDPEKLAAFRTIMREFYAPLKACDKDLEFVFIAGITKFSQLSIFSELNNMQNISMDPAHASICGITEDELLDNMESGVAALANKRGVPLMMPSSCSKRSMTGATSAKIPQVSTARLAY